MRPRGLLFDLDGTLVDSYEAIRDGLSFALAGLGGRPVGLQETRRLVGHGLERLLRDALAAQGLAAGEPEIREGGRLFGQRYAEVVFEKTALLPGVAGTLGELHARGHPMGVASNKPARFCRAIVEHFGLAPFLPVVLGPEDAEAPKPHPSMLLRLAGALGRPPEECTYVGDMPIDVTTARAAGMRVVCVTFGGASREVVAAARPDALADRFGEIPDLVARG